MGSDPVVVLEVHIGTAGVAEEWGPSMPWTLLSKNAEYLYDLEEAAEEVDVKEFSFSDLSRRSGDVLDTAVKEPVSLMKRGKPRIVMLPVEEFERMRQALQRVGSGSVHTIYDAPDEDIQALMREMQDIISDAERPE